MIKKKQKLYLMTISEIQRQFVLLEICVGVYGLRKTVTYTHL